MSGRGRPRKAENPEPKCTKSKTTHEEINQVSSPRKDLKEDKHNGATKEQKPRQRAQKMPKQADEKPSAQSSQKEKTAKHITEETKQKTPPNDVKAPVNGAKAKTRAGRATTTEQSTVEIAMMKPRKPKNKTEDCPDIKKERKYAVNPKSTEQLDEEKTKSTPKTPKETTKASLKTTKEKKSAGKAKSPEKIPEDTMRMQPETNTHTTKACAPRTQCEAAMGSLLFTTLENLKIRKAERANAAKVINQITKSIIDHVKQNIDWFKEIEQIPTGSYYENLKISNPDEFDVMLAIPVDRVDIKPFNTDGAYYSVGLKRGNNPLKKFQEEDVLSSSAMLSEFREEVKKCVKAFKEWTVTRKKTGCPAVTLTTTVNSVTISLDVVLCIKVKSSWPAFTTDGFKIERWLGAKVKQEHKRKAYYLVPKYEGRGRVEIDGVQAKDAWRISFSHVEKAILMNHGSQKTCCEKEGQRCCRKDCLKLLKHLLSRLKEQDPSFDKFYSYQAKTTLLHACCSRTQDCEWRASELSRCFLQLLEDFVGHLKEGVLPNFFIPNQNLLAAPGQKKCDSLIRRIEEERDKGFPIFT
ncbi:hypothetical protein INR49_007653 [Caranx melampygus]|nr:hypothetical protein INR49_007653 [Caranx melampygus]